MKLFIAAIALLAFAIPCTAQTINAATCNASDVQTAFNSVSSSTTTVNIPQGNCTWTTQVTLNVPSGNTSLTVAGAGNSSTLITENYNSSSPVLSITTNSTSSGELRVTGISLTGTNSNVKFSGLIGVGGSEQFRFDHNTLDTSQVSQEAGMRIGGCTYGVADHNTINTGNGFVNNGIQEYNQGSCLSDSLGLGDQVWAHATNFGSANEFYLENNTFNNGFANDCTLGGSYGMRFNTFNETSNSNSVVQTHPTGGAARWRGCRQSEIYKNTFNITSFMNACVFFSSGPGLMWGNSAASTSAGGGEGCKQMMQIESVLVNNVAYGQVGTPSGWGYCGTSSGLTGDGSAWAGSTSGSGYPCLDQPGRGQGDLLVGGFVQDGSGSDNVCDQTVHGTGANCGGFGFNGNWPNQALEPVYAWNDAWQPVPNNTSHYVAIGVGSNVLTQNTDFYTGVDDSGNPISFNGTTGVGIGTRAARPSTCTKGVAYWSTDQGSWNNSGSGGQGVLDLCTATNTWTNAWYTPYTYPHPLVSAPATLPPTPVSIGIVL